MNDRSVFFMTKRVSAAKLKKRQRCELLNTAVIGPVRVFDLDVFVAIDIQNFRTKT